MAFAPFLTGLTDIAAGVAHAQTRSLKLYYLHTGEKADITYKRNGRYVDSGLKKINYFLRDWRRNEPTKMDPRLLDLVWEVYRQSGSRQYIHVISGYRSPATNTMLRQRGRGVAKHSQHTLGKAMDFFLPDVKLSKLREIGLKMEIGGVGFYPTSGSPFVHLDTGNVRHWPRMTRQELARVFPDGKTLHIPSDGKPLPGYEVALASYKTRKARGGEIVVAKADDSKKPGFFQQLFAATKEDEQDDEESNAIPAPRTVQTSPRQETATALASADEVRPAALAGVPIPTWAPRTDAASGTQLAVASPQSGADPSANDDLPAASGDAQGGDAQDGEQIELASIPVPEMRPDYAPTALVAQAASERSLPVAPAGSSVVASLTAEEIENLRRTAVPIDRPRPIAELTAQQGPAARDVPDSPTTAATDMAQGTRLALLDETPERESGASAKSVEQLEKLSVTPAPRPQYNPGTSSIMVASITPMPQSRPTPRASPRTVELALAASTEDSSEAGEAIRTMIEANNRVRLETAQAADDRNGAATASPVSAHGPQDEPKPVGRVSGEAVMAANAGKQETSDPDDNGPAQASSWKIAGVTTLSDRRSMERIAEMRAPAYGMSLVRKAPDKVLMAGFVRTTLPQPAGAFAGSSALVPDFASFRTN